MQALAMMLLATSAVLIRGGLKDLTIAESFRDIFVRLPVTGFGGGKVTGGGGGGSTWDEPERIGGR